MPVDVYLLCGLCNSRVLYTASSEHTVVCLQEVTFHVLVCTCILSVHLKYNVCTCTHTVHVLVCILYVHTCM